MSKELWRSDGISSNGSLRIWTLHKTNPAATRLLHFGEEKAHPRLPSAPNVAGWRLV
jgi:hypothetical protein